MYAKLTIPERLKDLRVMEKHLTLEELAEQTGLSKSALGKYETDEYKDISPFAIVTLAEFYGVSTGYLLGLTETKNHPNTTLDELHLSDAAIDILKNGKLNNRLICEILCHEDFRRLLVDSEVFVDRIAEMHILDWSHATQGNASADAARTYLLFVLSGQTELANKYLDLFCKKSDTAKQYVQQWMPIVAASQSVKGNPEERELLLSWVNVVDYE